MNAASDSRIRFSMQYKSAIGQGLHLINRRHNGTKRFTHRLAGQISIVARSSGTQLPASHSGIGCWGPLLLESQFPTLRDRRHIGSPMLVIDSSPARMLKSSAKPTP